MTDNYFTRVGDLLDEEIARINQRDGAQHAVQGSLRPFYVLLVLTTGENTTLENVHDAWAADRVTTRPDHADLVWFDELPAGVSDWDAPFAEAIRATAAQVQRLRGPIRLI